MPRTAPTPARQWSAVTLLVLLLVVSLVATRNGSVPLSLLDPCADLASCSPTAVYAAEFSARYSPLLVFLAVLPIGVARLLQRRNALPVVLLGAAAAALLLGATVVVVLIAG